MDSLTQIVLGAAVGEAVLGSKAGNKALLYGAIAGTIPDLDVLVGNFTDTITATEMHRGFSHSIVFAFIAAAVLGQLTAMVEARKNLGWKPWAWLFFWAIFTHPLLDIFTTWGTQLLWPLDNRLALNSIFVIDPLYTLPFLGCVIAVLFLRRGSLSRKRINNIGLIYSTSYLLLSIVLKQLALSQFIQALEQQNIPYKEISTRPAAFNTILWNANIETEDAYLIADYSFFDSQPIKFDRYPKSRESELQPKNPASRENLERLIKITKGWYLMDKEEGQWYFYDLRFGRMPVSPGEEQFVFTYELFYDEREILQARERERKVEDAQFLMSYLWNRIKGN